MDGKWLVVSNCQVIGLANCLSLLLNDVQIDQYEIKSYFQNEDHIAQSLPEYDHIVIHPEILRSTKVDFRSLENVTCVPDVIFWALQPDLTYVLGRGEMVQGPLSDYHSAIAITAYKLGLGPAQARLCSTRNSMNGLAFLLYGTSRKPYCSPGFPSTVST